MLGRWMFFAKKGEEHDRLWSELCNLYLDRKLECVVSLKSSTGRSVVSSRSSYKESDEGVIQVYCGPYNDKVGVLKVGTLLVGLSNYHSR